MPIYEYRCKGCECEFETLIIGSSDKAQCPECQGEDVVRLMSACSHKNEGKYVSSSGSSCGGCTASSCASCH